MKRPLKEMKEPVVWIVGTVFQVHLSNQCKCPTGMWMPAFEEEQRGQSGWNGESECKKC